MIEKQIPLGDGRFHLRRLGDVLHPERAQRWYGTCVACTPVCSLNISPARCAGVPKPPDENVILFGWLLSKATNSDSVLAGTECVTTRM